MRYSGSPLRIPPGKKAYKFAFLTYLFVQSKKDALRAKHYPDQPLKLLVPISSRMKEGIYKSYMQLHTDTKSFIIVRHPFSRLVSAFRDKIERTRVKGTHGSRYFEMFKLYDDYNTTQ